jgi:hypothetical protein
VSATIVIIVTDVRSPKQFMAMSLEERRRSSIGWKAQPSRTGRHPDAVLVMATNISLDVLELELDEDPKTGEKVRSFMIDRKTIEGVVPRLDKLVNADRDATAKALIAKVGGEASPERLGRVTEALKAGTWPTNDDAAEEAAAFAKHVFGYGEAASLSGLGLCWEYRGDFPLGDQNIVAPSQASSS